LVRPGFTRHYLVSSLLQTSLKPTPLPVVRLPRRPLC
jgi:hypothetical protein